MYIRWLLGRYVVYNLTGFGNEGHNEKIKEPQLKIRDTSLEKDNVGVFKITFHTHVIKKEDLLISYSVDIFQ